MQLVTADRLRNMKYLFRHAEAAGILIVIDPHAAAGHLENARVLLLKITLGVVHVTPEARCACSCLVCWFLSCHIGVPCLDVSQRARVQALACTFDGCNGQVLMSTSTRLRQGHDCAIAGAPIMFVITATQQ